MSLLRCLPCSCIVSVPGPGGMAYRTRRRSPNIVHCWHYQAVRPARVESSGVRALHSEPEIRQLG